MEKALGQYRKALEFLYTDKATITGIKMIKDPDTKVQKKIPVSLYENIPCRLSFSPDVVPTKEGLNYSTERKDKMFVSPEISVEPGAKIKIIKSTGQVFEYVIGEIKAYPTHNEYPLLGIKVSL